MLLLGLCPLILFPRLKASLGFSSSVFLFRLQYRVRYIQRSRQSFIRIVTLSIVASVEHFIAQLKFGLACFLWFVRAFESSCLGRCNCPEPKTQSISVIMFLMLFLGEHIEHYVGILSKLILLLLLLMPLLFW
uniref:Uncharacterized protein n=1 Tax=Opuntia streptacantha TaxID=393608 RepID=A0A7C9CX83_OPUST